MPGFHPHHGHARHYLSGIHLVSISARFPPTIGRDAVAPNQLVILSLRRRICAQVDEATA